MTKKTDAADTARRDFLKLSAGAVPLAAVATVSGVQQAEAVEPDLSSDRLQDTAHTRAYYDRARF